ncbi:MAG TPA: sigma-70 family RNA polymerase sigma factor [Pseudomonadota bacterium]|nr:sigma-70 family RNA polymerase sigma factor [Pseudomonadota bacterium]
METLISQETLAALLHQSQWVRRLAGSLVRNDALADDLTQETWAAALAHPPTAGLPVRPWLSQVMRNLVRMRFRSDRRRQGRETAAGEAALGAGGHLDSPEQLAARVSVQRLLSEHVLSLPEPFRSTLILRFYEGLSASEIAKRQAVPAGTVRWRLKSGLDRLRETLDEMHGGNRQAWWSLVAPLSIAPRPTVELGSPAGPSGASLLSGKGLLALGLLASVMATGLYAARRPKDQKAGSPALASPRRAAAPTDPGAAQQRIPNARAELLSKLAAARATATATRRSSASLRSQPELSAEYIREQMTALLPLVKECYENALVDRPQLAGKLTVRFTIVGEPAVGGLVSESSIDTAASTIFDEGLRECIQETMYAARFPAPKEGGEVHVTYPFVLANDR